ncbi:MAG: PPC domain-containing protein [Vicinamibacterales bacterium]
MRLGLSMIGVAAALSASVTAQAPAPLPMGAPAQGKVGGEPTEYVVAAKTAGVLSVAVQGTSDLSLQLVDEDGQVMPDGSTDRDMNGNEGTELLSVTLTQPGTYRLRVRSNGDGGTFQIAGSFMSFPPFQRPGDPDGRPRSAKPAQVGKAFEDGLDPSAGDNWDWWVLKAPEAGTLTVVTRQVGSDDAPDLVLEIYTDGDFGDAKDRSDQDLQGNSANESTTVQVTAGQSVHVKVSSNFGRTAKYRLSSSLAP